MRHTFTIDYNPNNLQSADDAHDLYADLRRKFPLTKASATYLTNMRAQLACTVAQIDAELAWRAAKERGEITTV